MTNSEIPRAERICKNCDHSRTVQNELRCWAGPPQPCMIGLEPPKLAGQPPRPIIIGVIPPTWWDYSCPKWTEQQPDHPDIQPKAIVLPTHEVSTEPQ